MASSEQTLQIASRFCGPPGSANGGYAAGILAAALEGPSEITLRAPPPLDTDLRLVADGKHATLHHGEALIAEAQVKPISIEPPPSPGFAAALAAQERYAGFRAHNFPGCFVCGPKRDDGDGLRVFAAAHGDVFAAAWQPAASLGATDGRVDERYLHAVLDCPSYFALGDATLLALLGRMHGEVFAAPHAGQECVIVAWPIDRDGRKHHSGAALYGSDDRLLAVALNTWIELRQPLPQDGR